MRSIVLKPCFLALLIACGCANAIAEESPRELTEPAFGLRYNQRHIRFERLPDEAWSHCETLTSVQHSVPVWFLYGRATDGNERTFYVIGGYEIVRKPEPGDARYLTSGAGLVFVASPDTCVEIGGVQETFNARSFAETPEHILRLLARDMAARYVQAFGGTRQLQLAMDRQRIIPDPYALELNEAFQPYLHGPAARRKPSGR